MISMKSRAAPFVDVWPPPKTSLAVLMTVTVTVAISGCNDGTADAPLAGNGKCSARVLVRFAAETDVALLADLERAHALELDPLGAITSDLGVYSLLAAGSDDACDAAVYRLRRDERVRSVDFDAQRELHKE